MIADAVAQAAASALVGGFALTSISHDRAHELLVTLDLHSRCDDFEMTSSSGSVLGYLDQQSPMQPYLPIFDLTLQTSELVSSGSRLQMEVFCVYARAKSCISSACYTPCVPSLPSSFLIQ